MEPETLIARQVMAQQAMSDLEFIIRKSDPLYGLALDYTLEAETPMHWPIWIWRPLLKCANREYWRGIAIKYNVIKA